MTDYRVNVQTGDVRWASTDANVQVQFIGVNGNSQLLKLDNSQDNFERDKLDTFGLTISDDVGWINEIRLKHDRDGIGDGWYVNWVEVIDVANGITSKAPFDRWLDADEDDGKTDVTKPVALGGITLDQGVLKTYYIGYRATRKQNSTSSPLQINEQLTWQETRGVSVKNASSTSLELGVTLGFKFLGVAGSSFTAKVTQTVATETQSQESSTATNQQTIAGVVAPGESNTWILLRYQEVLEGIAQGNGISVGWEVRQPGFADVVALSGWLSDQDVADTVRRILAAQAAGSGDPMPAVVQPEGTEFGVKTRALSGPINPATVKAALDANQRDRTTGTHNVVLNNGGNVVVNG